MTEHEPATFETVQFPGELAGEIRLSSPLLTQGLSR